MQCITLTTDFGSQNAVLAGVKGLIYSALPEGTLTDITHDISPYNTPQAVYYFKQAYLHFPENSVHFVLFNLYEHPGKQLLYVYENKQHIFCADNGFLTMLFDDKPIQIFRLNEPVYRYDVYKVTEQFIHAWQMIRMGDRHIIDNISIGEILIKKPGHPIYSNNTVDAQVLTIDRFGNVVLNVTRDFFEDVRKSRNFRILFMKNEELNNISEHYFDVEPGDVLARFNLAGYLEIAVNKGNAAELFGFKEWKEGAFFYDHIKIYFE